jgi:hypothetical protein
MYEIWLQFLFNFRTFFWVFLKNLIKYTKLDMNILLLFVQSMENSKNVKNLCAVQYLNNPECSTMKTGNFEPD